MAPEDTRAALVVVDVQYDFLPGGALAVGAGDAVLTPLSRLMNDGGFRIVVATQDWHPRGHVSFASSHPGRAPFEEIELYGRPQTLWPDHCVQGTAGARLHDDVPVGPVDVVIRKGTDPAVDSYSAFCNNWDERGKRPTTGLAGLLRERGVERVWVAGLARDYCVLWTAQDAVEAGFEVVFLWDLTRPVDPASDDLVRADLESRGVKVLEGVDPF